MKTHLLIFLAIALACLATAPAHARSDAFAKSTVWTGKVAAIDEHSISVTNEKALTRAFVIDSGTVFGNGKGKLSNFPVGSAVVVSFSEIPGTSNAKAENISPPKPPKAAKKKKK